jgi:hypothetical protein
MRVPGYGLASTTCQESIGHSVETQDIPASRLNVKPPSRSNLYIVLKGKTCDMIG